MSFRTWVYVEKSTTFAKNFQKKLCTNRTWYFLFQHSVKIHPKKNTTCNQGFIIKNLWVRKFGKIFQDFSNFFPIYTSKKMFSKVSKKIATIVWEFTQNFLMAANKFKNQNPTHLMRRCSMHPRGLGFFSFGRGWGTWVFSSLFWVRGVVSVFFFILGHGWRCMSRHKFVLL
jgi:hypothetical protein